MKAQVIVFLADLLVAGIPPPPRPKLTPQELSRVVRLLGKGWTLQRAIDQIQKDRPTLPLDPPLDPPEAA
jgi:hypothetical protein